MGRFGPLFSNLFCPCNGTCALWGTHGSPKGRNDAQIGENMFQMSRHVHIYIYVYVYVYVYTYVKICIEISIYTNTSFYIYI